MLNRFFILLHRESDQVLLARELHTPVSPLCKAHAISSVGAMPLTLKVLHKQASGNLSMGALQSSLPHCINAQSETIQILLKAHHFNYKNYGFFWF